MSPLDRYSEIRNTTHLRESGPQLDLALWPEHELQAAWFAGRFGREFRACDGRAVRVVQFGTWNREAGPDFASAAVSLDGGAPLAGSVELDPDARDWERHGHATNPAYDNVVLHVFATAGGAEFFTRTSAHRNVPQVHLDPTLLDESPADPPRATPGRCAAPLAALPVEKVREVLTGAAHYRLRKKAAALARSVDIHGQDEALYQALAAALGYKANKLPFTLLAQRLPLRLLRGDAVAVDALLFGVAGFLNQRNLGDFDQPTRVYLRSLWDAWWPRRAEFERLIVAPCVWRMSSQRPANHPQRRLAALAQLIRQWPRVRRLAAACEPAEIADFCAGLRDDHWDQHYTVTSKPSARRMALIGASRATEMIVNVFLPLATLDAPEKWALLEKLPAPLENQRAEIAAVRLFGAAKQPAWLLKSAAMQQGLLQIYEDFCARDLSDCANCPFPEQLAKW